MRAALPAIRLRRGPEAITVLRAMARATLVAGLLIAGFIGYQFGVTSFFATRAQAGLAAGLSQRVATIELTEVPYVRADVLPAPFALPADLPAFDPASIAGADPIALQGPDALAPIIHSEPVPAPGNAVGRIVIPAAGVDWTVVEGVSRADLKAGAGHMPGTALPGQPGNAVISGHRTTYGAPFLHLDRVSVGDLITVETASGTHVYQVAETLVVDPSDTWVAAQWDGAWLTLTTCEPVLSSRQRLVVVATLVAGPNAGVILGGS
jgi:sortase A